MNFCKAHFLNETAGFFKILFGFAGESNDNVGCKSAVREEFADVFNNLAVHVGVISSSHAVKGSVTSALERKMKLGAKVREFCKTLNVQRMLFEVKILNSQLELEEQIRLWPFRF